ncbi:hypothetical protein [Psychrobacter aquaticus]|uniref:Uncharacterized protein n=1 Tax=Psychrobacter aquaticus CMS 56 TaxID=1354303 RepID=U4T2H8_9GAMM|nr:hypothetical protein [Psychrobacter aquaticus]ERL55187.1 hypothetical protein M917_1920 [Psychrobacter aquaticus CMS 56]
MDIVATVTALAALLTALANSFIIFEMRKQRTATTKPVLKLLSKYSKAIVEKESKEWAWENKESSHFIDLNLINFGTGPSLNLAAEWDISLDKLVDALKYFDPYKQMKFSHKKGFVEIDKSFHAIHNQKIIFLEAVPVSQNKKEVSIKLPSYFISAFEKYVQLGILDRPQTETTGPFEIPDFPSASVTLNYEDINGIKFHQKFLVTISFSSVFHANENTGTEVNASFNVKEVS